MYIYVHQKKDNVVTCLFSTLSVAYLFQCFIGLRDLFVILVFRQNATFAIFSQSHVVIFSPPKKSYPARNI